MAIIGIGLFLIGIIKIEIGAGIGIGIGIAIIVGMLITGVIKKTLRKTITKVQKILFTTISIIFLVLIMGIVLLVITVKGKEAFYINLAIYIITFLLFFLLLPIINALFDWLSLSITRKLGELTLKHKNRFAFVFFALVDSVLAGVFFVTILKTLQIVINFIDKTFITTFSNEYLNIDEKIEHFFNNPFDIDSLWIGAMVLTTLLPTLIHLVFVLLKALWTPFIFSNKKIDELKEMIESKSRYRLSKVAFTLTIGWIETFFVALVILYLGGIYIYGVFELINSAEKFNNDWVYYLTYSVWSMPILVVFYKFIQFVLFVLFKIKNFIVTLLLFLYKKLFNKKREENLS